MHFNMTSEQQADVKKFLDKAYDNGNIRESVKFTEALTDYAFYAHNLRAEDSPGEETETNTGMMRGVNELFAQFGFTLNGSYFVKRIGEAGLQNENYKALSEAPKSGIQRFIDEQFALGGDDASKYIRAVWSTMEQTGIPAPGNVGKSLTYWLKWGAEVMPQFGYKVVGTRLYKADTDTTDWISAEVRALLEKSELVKMLGSISQMPAAAFVFTLLSMLADLGVKAFQSVSVETVGIWEEAKAYPDDVVDLFEKAGYRIDADSNKIFKNAAVAQH